MNWLIETVQRYPEIAIFFTLAIGFAIGEISSGTNEPAFQKCYSVAGLV
jgi:hypothetical protein